MPRSSVFRLLAVFFVSVSILGGGQVAAQNGTYTISGTVSDGRPGSGMVGCPALIAGVYLWENDTPITAITSEADGTFILPNIPNGRYSLYAAVGRSSHSETIYVTVSDGNVADINLLIGQVGQGYELEFGDCTDPSDGNGDEEPVFTFHIRTGTDDGLCHEYTGTMEELSSDPYYLFYYSSDTGQYYASPGVADGPCPTEHGDDDDADDENGNGDPGIGNGNGDETPGNGDGGDTPGEGDAVENSFTLTTAQRMCADQSFNATWTGANIASIEFALNNSSDDWSSGWLAADPAAGTFTAAVDHHGYDRAAARATFVDGTTQQAEIDTVNCSETAAPAPVDPAPVPDPAPVDPTGSGQESGSAESSGSGTSSGSGNSANVSSLPSTGAGQDSSNTVILAVTATILLSGAALFSRVGFTRR